MGHGVGQALVADGHEVITCLAGRSEHTRALATRAGMCDAGTLDTLVTEAGTILSILPPDRAVTQAGAVAAAMRATDARPAYIDCNAISPMTMEKVTAAFAGLDVTVIDCGIIGLNPIKAPPTRFFVSGPDCSPAGLLASDAIKVERMGTKIGQASALKMVYAALTKGTWTLHAAVLMAAMRLGVLEPLLDEFAYSQSGTLSDMRRRTPFLPADSARWVPEMEEIAATFASAGVTPDFHNGAAGIFRVLSRTPFAQETRETLEKSRTLEEALAVYVKHLT